MNSRKLKISVGVVALFFALKWWFAAPSEAQLKSNFIQHRAEFEELRSMVQADTAGDSRVHIGRDFAERELGQPLSDTRVGRYRMLMRSVGVIGINGGKDRFRMSDVRVWWLY